LQSDLIAVKKKKVTLHVFMCEILANMTQVSDVALGPLVTFASHDGADFYFCHS
jgi:hypothetical protein